MGWLSFLFGGSKKGAKGKPGAKVKSLPPPVRSPERQQMEADIIANMRKIRQKLAETDNSPFSGATEEQVMEGLRRWTAEQQHPEK